MTPCKTCNTKYPDVCLIKNTCYLCILKKWPPKTKKQYRTYENAVAIRLRLTTPLDNQEDALRVVKKIGLDDLLKVQSVIDGGVVPHVPGNTFYQRLVGELGE